MRDHIYRGKTVYGEWIYGSLIIPDDNDAIICIKGSVNIHVIRETVGEYIGQKAKGLMIFEGDIVKADLDFEPDERVGLIGEIVFKKGAFMLSQTWRKPEYIDYYTSWINDYHNIEVIGNKYDSPELLKS